MYTETAENDVQMTISQLKVVSSCEDHGIYEYIMRYVYKSLLLLCID